MLDRICKLNVKGCVRRSSSSLLSAESRNGDGRTPEKLQMDMARWKHSKQTIFPRDMRPSLQIRIKEARNLAEESLGRNVHSFS
jgi:hypothetical protein